MSAVVEVCSSMDYLKQVTVVVCMVLAIVDAQSFAEDSFNSRYNEDKHSNYFSYNTIKEKIPSPVVVYPNEPFHDIYTYKGQKGETQRVHYALDENGPRANIQSNVVQFGQDLDPTEGRFGARLQPIISQEYSTRQLNGHKEEIPIFQELRAEFVQPIVETFPLPTPIPYPVDANLLSENENNIEILQGKRRLSLPPTSEIKTKLRYSPPNQKYESQRITKATYTSLLGLPNVASEHSSLTDKRTSTISENKKNSGNVPKGKGSEYQKLFKSAQLVPKRTEFSKSNGKLFRSKGNKLQTDVRLKYGKNKTLLQSTRNGPKEVGFLKNNERHNFQAESELERYSTDENIPEFLEKSSTLSQTNTHKFENNSESTSFEIALPEKLDEEQNLPTKYNLEAHATSEAKTKSQLNNSTSDILQNHKPASIKSYFTTKSQLESFQSPSSSFPKSLISSPMSKVFDSSDENGQYFHYIMNLGQNSKRDRLDKTKIFSTGSALYKLLNETGMEFKPSFQSNSQNKKVITSKNSAKVLGILSEKIKKLNSKKLTNKVSSDLETDGDFIDTLNTTRDNSSVRPNMIKINNKILNISDEIFQQINRIITKNETYTPQVDLNLQISEAASSTPSSITETVSSFLKDLFGIHETITNFPINNYKNLTTSTTQSPSDFYFGETPLYVSGLEALSDLKLMSTNITDPLGTTKLSTETTTDNDVTQQVTTVGTYSPFSEAFSTPVPKNIPSEKNTSLDYTNPANISEKVNQKTEEKGIVTITQEPTESTTTPMSISPIKLKGKDNEYSINRVQDESVLVEIDISNNSPENVQMERVEDNSLLDTDRPKLELVIQSSEMNDFMQRINNLPIFIRVLNPKLTELKNTEDKPAINQNKTHESIEKAPVSQILNKTKLTLNHIQPAIEETIDATNRTLRFSPNKVKESNDSSHGIIRDLVEVQLKDNSFNSPVGEESKANMEVLSSDESLQLIPIFFENEYGIPDINEESLQFQNVRHISDTKSNRDNLGLSDKLTVEQLQNSAMSDSDFPLTMEYVINTPYRDFYINEKTPNPFSINYDNDSYSRLIESNINDSLHANMNIDDFESYPSLEYVDLIPYPDFNTKDRQMVDSVDEISTNSENSDNFTDTLFQNDRKMHNVYDLSPLREYIDIIPYDENAIVMRNALNEASLDILHPANLSYNTTQDIATSHKKHDFPISIEYADSIHYPDDNVGSLRMISEDQFIASTAEGYIPNQQNSVNSNNVYQDIDYLRYLYHDNNGDESNHIRESSFVNDVTNGYKTQSQNNVNYENSNIQEAPSESKYIDFMHYSPPPKEITNRNDGRYLITDKVADKLAVKFETMNQNNLPDIANVQESSSDDKYIDFVPYSDPYTNQGYNVPPDTVYGIPHYNDLPSTVDSLDQFLLLEGDVDVGTVMGSSSVLHKNGNRNTESSPAPPSSERKYGIRLHQERLPDDRLKIVI